MDANDTEPQDRDDALERAIRRISQLIKEGQYAMATYETGTSKGKETATEQTLTLMMEEQLQQWQTYASKLKEQVKEKETLLADKEIKVQTLQAVATGKK